VAANVRQQMAQDRKSTALKQLQGHVWATGYASGALQGTLYPDVVSALHRWSSLASPPRVCIYSSGSVEAQRLIFSHTSVGSLSRFLSAYFDTAVGMKQDSGSYAEIMRQLAVQPSRLLFLTDVEGEARACLKAGGDAIIVVREGNKPVEADSGLRLIHSFDELQLLGA
jgi:2,3-diketo-5-methylthio-1-phosphopentane phosphatase